MKNNYQNNAKVFKAFCDENRLMILEMLQSGEKCACHLLDNLNKQLQTLDRQIDATNEKIRIAQGEAAELRNKLSIIGIDSSIVFNNLLKQSFSYSNSNFVNLLIPKL